MRGGRESDREGESLRGRGRATEKEKENVRGRERDREGERFEWGELERETMRG